MNDIAHWIPLDKVHFKCRVFKCSNCGTEEAGGFADAEDPLLPCGYFCRWCGKRIRGAGDEQCEQ